MSLPVYLCLYLRWILCWISNCSVRKRRYGTSLCRDNKSCCQKVSLQKRTELCCHHSGYNFCCDTLNLYICLFLDFISFYNTRALFPSYEHFISLSSIPLSLKYMTKQYIQWSNKARGISTQKLYWFFFSFTSFINCPVISLFRSLW